MENKKPRDILNIKEAVARAKAEGMNISEPESSLLTEKTHPQRRSQRKIHSVRMNLHSR